VKTTEGLTCFDLSNGRKYHIAEHGNFLSTWLDRETLLIKHLNSEIVTVYKMNNGSLAKFAVLTNNQILQPRQGGVNPTYGYGPLLIYADAHQLSSLNLSDGQERKISVQLDSFSYFILFEKKLLIQQQSDHRNLYELYDFDNLSIIRVRDTEVDAIFEEDQKSLLADYDKVYVLLKRVHSDINLLRPFQSQYYLLDVNNLTTSSIPVLDDFENAKFCGFIDASFTKEFELSDTNK
jgi:hypothetical protein